MTLILRPPGRGNWAPLIMKIDGERSAPLLVRVGQLLTLGGQVFRIAGVKP
jgi:hypothetical protein